VHHLCMLKAFWITLPCNKTQTHQLRLTFGLRMGQLQSCLLHQHSTS
jgi:hypothetical protein